MVYCFRVGAKITNLNETFPLFDCVRFGLMSFGFLMEQLLVEPKVNSYFLNRYQQGLLDSVLTFKLG